MQNFYFAQLVWPISSVFTEQSRIGVMNWLSRFLVSFFSTIEKSIAKVHEQLIRKLAPTLWTEVQASTNRLRDHEEKFAKLSKEIKVTQTFEIAGFMKKVSLGQCFRTLDDIDDGFGEKLGHAESIHHLVTMTIRSQWDGPVPVGWIRGFTKICPVIQVRATRYLDQCEFEIQVPSMLKDGSLSWVVTSRFKTATWMKPMEEIEEPPL